MKRQNIRKLTLLISLLLFPVTMWYFSPAIISMAMMKHIMNGSFFVFMAMLVCSTFAGRLFCGYLCPAGGLQECAAQVNGHAAKQGGRDKIKFVIWTVWIMALIVLFILGNGNVTADFFFMTDHGVSVTEVFNYVIYYGVITLLVAPALIHGKRAACHYICWMAPFMMTGQKAGQLLHIPQLHIASDKNKCINCKKCVSVCPMGLDVHKMVSQSQYSMSTECINCGACVDSCPKKALKYSMKAK
ncbi:MAG: 4Fe-4S binding protein [Oscillospiraceae bacterium]|nr:4Fe-4S binding protein [Oscillospiraceae bacterium]